MAIAFVGATGNSTTTAATLELTPHASTADGHTMIAVVSVRGPNLTQNTITPPAGWTPVEPTFFESGSPSLNVGVYVKEAASEGAAYSWGFNSSNEATGSLLTYSGVDTTTPVHVHAIGGQDAGSTTRTTPDITISLSDCWVLSYFADRSGSTWVGPDTERNEVKVPATSASQVVCDSAATVATGTTSRTATASASSSVAVQGILALAPEITATPKASTDTATATETAATVEATVPATDTATATETAAISATATATDSATATETATVAVLGEPTVSMAIDWNDDGDFTGPGEDITDRIMQAGGFKTDVGRDQARALSPPKSGQASFALNNISGDYSPENPDSPLAGDLLPARAFRALVDLDGVTYTLFQGFLDDFEVKVTRNSFTVDVTALDVLAKLKGAKVSTLVFESARVGEAIGYVLDAVGWPEELRDLDPGATIVRWWWLNDEDAFDAIVKLIGSEGPGALIHADEQGRLVFRDRHHRLLNETSTISQATITDGAGGHEPAFSAFTYDHGWRDIVNTVSFSVEEREPAAVPETVYDEETLVRSIAAGETLTIDVQTTEPLAIIPDLSYTRLAGAPAVTLYQLAAQELQIEIVAGASPAKITNVKIDGQPVKTARTYTVKAEDAASVGKYGARSPTSTIEAPWAGVNDAEAIAQLIVGARSERLPTVTIEMRGIRNDVRLVQMIGRDLSDRVHIRETRTGLDADFHIEQIAHTIAGPDEVITSFGMEKAAVQPANVFRFDDPDHGFDNGVFGTVGLDDPEQIFIFDDPDRGFDEGVFAS